MLDEIQNRFTGNIERARNLLQLYEGLDGGGQGRRPVHATDILRAATVFTHAAIEELLRGIAAWKYPDAPETILNEVPLVGISEHARPEKFFLGKLTAHREKTAQQIINESVQAFLGTFTVNNTTDISSFLRKFGVDVDAVNESYPQLSTLIDRRHHIVHQADKNENRGRGNHRARPIHQDTVREWIDATSQFGDAVINELR